MSKSESESFQTSNEASGNAFSKKIFGVVTRALAVYPGATMAAGVKGGASYPEAFRHMLEKVRHLPNPRSGSGAYVGASTASMMPATLVDPLQKKLMEHGIDQARAEKFAVGFSAISTAIATNFRNLAFTGGKHGLDGKKIFKPFPFSASLLRDTATGFVYAKALQGKSGQSPSEKTKTALQHGFLAGVLTSLPDTFAYMMARSEKMALRPLLERAARVAPVRGVNVAVGAGVMALLTANKKEADPPDASRPIVGETKNTFKIPYQEHRRNHGTSLDLDSQRSKNLRSAQSTLHRPPQSNGQGYGR